MCGIFGLITAEKNDNVAKRRETFLNGMLFNVPRGVDSTGVAGFWTQQEAKETFVVSRVSKKALHFIDWTGSKSADWFLDKFGEYDYVLGHVRATTKGMTSDKNAHPFEYGDYTLIHNGTVYNRSELVKADENVDSADICATMAERGEADTLKGLEGGFSLAWHNAKDDTLNLARNNRKPMSFAYIKGKNQLWYCSEWTVLYCVLMRNGLKPEVPIQITRPGVHYKFNKNDLRNFKEVKFPEYKKPPISPSQAAWESERAQYNSPTLIALPAPETPPEDPTVSYLTKSDEKTSSSTSDSTTVSTLTTKERTDYITKVLGPYDLKVGMTILMDPKKFAPYKRSRGLVGVMWGERFAHPGLILYVPEIAVTEWDSFKDKKVGVTIENVRGPGDKPEVQCRVNPSWTNMVNRKEGSKSEEKQQYGFDADIRRYFRKNFSSSGAITRILLSSKEAADAFGISMDEAERQMRLPTKERTFYGPNGRIVTKREWDNLVSIGCGECSSAIDALDDPTDGRQIVWLENAPLCLSCSMKHEAEVKLGIKVH